MRPALVNSLSEEPCLNELPEEWKNTNFGDQSWFKSKLPSNPQVLTHIEACAEDTNRLNQLLAESSGESARLETPNLTHLISSDAELDRHAEELSKLTSALVIKQYGDIKTLNRHLSRQVEKSNAMQAKIASLEQQIGQLSTELQKSHQAQHELGGTLVAHQYYPPSFDKGFVELPLHETKTEKS